MHKCLVSIIIPIYNVEAYLSECIISVINQTYSNLEIILVNDGSPDNCGAICDAYAKEDARIKVIHKENGGLSDARNAGLDICTGDYISFIDSDDVVHPDFISSLYYVLIETNSDLAICTLKKFENEFSLLDIYKSDKAKMFIRTEIFDEFYNPIYNLNFLVAWNKLYDKKLFKNIRYPVDRIHEDQFVIHHIFNKCNRIVYSFSEFYFYRQRPGSIMSIFTLKRYYDMLDCFEDRIKFSLNNKMFDFEKKIRNRKSFFILEAFQKTNYDSVIKADIYRNIFSIIKYLYNTKQYFWKEKIFVVLKLFL
jgi:glycosyltransferase involved in cell wall biosynthesis